MIKSSSHTTKSLNIKKLSLYNEFLTEYNLSLQFYIDYIWNSMHDDLNLPKYYNNTGIKPVDTKLSARALKCSVQQALGIVKSAIQKQKRILFINKTHNKSLPIKSFSKPIIKNLIGAELNSICCDFINTNGKFDGFLQLKSIGKYYGKIRIPISNHRHSLKLQVNGIRKNSYLFKSDFVDFRYELPEITKRNSGKIIGIDQGINSLVTLSDGQCEKTDIHGYTYKSIIKKMSKKKKGSKSFKKCQIQRDNFINWNINQLNFSDIKEIRFEKIYKLRNGKNYNRFMTHFNYSAIKNKIEDICLMNGVHFIEQDNKFRSQRCFSCGFVHKYNRKNDKFTCRSCGYESNADLNAAMNLSIDLPNLPFYIWQRKMNLVGFHWKVGVEFTVPYDEKVT